jgi:hypothetical protein
MSVIGTTENSNKRRRVQLIQEPVVFAISDEITEVEREMTWWQQDEFDKSKASVKQMCRTLRKERRFSNCLTDAYARACCMTSTASGSLAALDEHHFEELRKNEVRVVCWFVVEQCVCISINFYQELSCLRLN